MASTPDFQVPGWGITIVALVAAVISAVFLPPLGWLFAAFAGLRVAQWSCGTGRSQFHASMGDIIGALRYRSWGEKVFYGSAAATLLWVATALPWYLTYLAWPALLAPIAAFALPILAAQWLTKAANEKHATRARWTQVLATIAGVAPSVIETQAGIAERADGTVVISPLPPAIAAKVGTPDLEQRLAAVAPTHEIDPTSDYRALVLRPVSYETAQARAALQQSGGLFKQDLNADVPVPQTAATTGTHLSLEDLL